MNLENKCCSGSVKCTGCKTYNNVNSETYMNQTYSTVNQSNYGGMNNGYTA